MTRIVYLIIGLLGSLACGNMAAADVYKTVDKNGHITYTDKPPSDTNAKPIELKSINSIPAAQVTPYTPANNQNNAQGDADYQINILAPENGKTLLADERSIGMSVSLNQSLVNGDLLDYKLDGTTLTKTQDKSYTIIEPPRGEHTLTVDVVDGEGKVLAQSNAVTVVIMRPIVKPAAAPAPRK